MIGSTMLLGEGTMRLNLNWICFRNDRSLKPPFFIFILIIIAAPFMNCVSSVISGPEPLIGGRLIYDPVGDKIYLFGGSNSNNDWAFSDRLWAYDYGTKTWSLIVTESGPSARFDSVLVYLPSSRAILLFGGYREGGRLDDTWLFDIPTGGWSQLTLDTRPSPRSDSAYCYDEDSDRVILFGGYGEKSLLADTWAFDPSSKTWVVKNPQGNPLPANSIGEYGGRMAYDSVNKKVIMFGGHWKAASGTTGYDNQVWVYDVGENTWALRNTGTKPLARYTHYMAYDPVNGKVVIFGGHDSSDSIVNDMWTYDYDENKWLEIASAVKPSDRHAGWMTCDSKAQSIILYGGGDDSTRSLSDTWVLKLSGYVWERAAEGSSTPDQQGIPGYPPEAVITGLVVIIIFLLWHVHAYQL
jgi:hypothetical protein